MGVKEKMSTRSGCYGETRRMMLVVSMSGCYTGQDLAKEEVERVWESNRIEKQKEGWKRK